MKFAPYETVKVGDMCSLPHRRPEFKLQLSAPTSLRYSICNTVDEGGEKRESHECQHFEEGRARYR